MDHKSRPYRKKFMLFPIPGHGSEGGALGFRQIGLCTLARLAATRPAIAVDPRQPSADYLRQAFTAEDGLSSSVVNDVPQTRDGFLIIGASNGVVRFDGHRFAAMNSDPPKALVVNSLAEGPASDLWVATVFGVAIDSVRCLRLTRAGVRPPACFFLQKATFSRQLLTETSNELRKPRTGTCSSRPALASSSGMDPARSSTRRSSQL
jgi:hypothetical protein